MTSHTETLKSLLKQHGRSITNARLRVFEQLSKQEALSMPGLVTQSSGVDRASVYRAVALFERLGIVQRLYSGWKYKLELSDKFAAHHHHLTCTNCGKTTSINERELESFIDRMAAYHHFKPAVHQVEIQGLCVGCIKQPAQGQL